MAHGGLRYIFPRMPSSISIALCTCNGADFLPAQLESLLEQRRLPDELVVGDDASTDGTLAILDGFAARAPFPVRVERNPQRLGVAENFARTMRRATGDLIATCDQDDVWAPERLARAEQAFEDPAVMLCFSDADLVDARLRPLGARLWRTLNVHADIPDLTGPNALSRLLRRRAVTGATMTVRAQLVAAAVPIGEGWIHDEWLSMFAVLLGKVAAIEEPLVRYRQHGRNAIGASRGDFVSRVRAWRNPRRREALLRARDQLRSLRAALAEKQLGDVAQRRDLDARIAHLEARVALHPSLLPRSAQVWRELQSGRYTLGPFGHWGALRDLLG